jgi:O-antigen biosynthesis protein
MTVKESQRPQHRNGLGAAPKIEEKVEKKLTERTPSQENARSTLRPTVKGKFLFLGDQKIIIRGVTYGPFRPEPDGSEYHTPESAAADFAMISARGLNAVRTYTVPPRWFLDLAHEHSLWVMVGLPWEQHITFLDDPQRMRSIEERVRSGVRHCAGHPAVLCYTIGNEIPAPIVRWHGRRRVEAFLERLYRIAKDEDPTGLVSYINYPTTEYLELPFLDFMGFNVYLETPAKFDSYLARLQNLAGNRPLIMAEIGLDSQRNGEDAQAETLRWMMQSIFSAGCAGAFIFAWTDEWHRGGHDILDWDFGLTTRERRPKAALVAVQETLAQLPFPAEIDWPRISIVICSYNGARTLRNSCAGVMEVDYPDYEVIVVDDGSTDATAAIAHEYGFTVLTTENRGLSSARNTGWQAATGEIVAYLDDDAYPDPHWLRYLAHTFLTTDFVAVGGPNIAPPGDGPVADAVANAPGGPIHVLLSDCEAEHLPGCNMAFRRWALEAVGGFDPQFRIAGDDVDLCWRLQDQGGRLGYHAAAMVWHHRRNTIWGYWKQQKNYGVAEAMLEHKWPQKYNSIGHLTWHGRLYNSGFGRALPFRKWRIYHGVWGSALFQSLYTTAPGTLWSLPLMPEWNLLSLILLLLSLLGLLWAPLLGVLPLFLICVGTSLVYAYTGASHASFPTPPQSWWERVNWSSLTMLLYLLQPLARLWGRLSEGLTPWRRRGVGAFAFPRPRVRELWSEKWNSPESRLSLLEWSLRHKNVVVLPGGDFDGWDLEVRGGLLGAVRMCLVIEEHGGGKQMIKLRSWPVFRTLGLLLTLLLTGLAAAAALDGDWFVMAVLAVGAGGLALQAFGDCAFATASYLRGASGLLDEDA